MRSHKPEKKEYSKEVSVWSSFLYYNDRLFRLACCGVLRRKGAAEWIWEWKPVFFSIHSWDVTVILCGRLLFVPLKFILKLLICSLAGGVFLVLIRISEIQWACFCR